jgi:hypothetical protein
MRCLLVDDHRLVGQAIGGLLREVCNLSTVVICSSVAEALMHMRQMPPDLLLLDVNLPGELWQDAVVALRRLNPEGRVIMITGMSEQFLPPPGLQSVLLSVVDKGRAWSELVEVVNAWKQECANGTPQPRELALLPLDRLSPRELRVFEALGKGLLNKEIARDLHLTVATVETYRKTMSAKLGISGAELVRASVLYRCCNSGGGVSDDMEG